MSRKIVLVVVVYIVVALVAYYFFFDWNKRKWREESDALTAEFLARYPNMKGFESDDFFFSSVWGRNAVWGGIALLLGSITVAFVLETVSQIRKDKRTRTGK
jgi:hypothetical protein